MGMEAQAYPAGVILALRADIGPRVSLYGGTNRTNRRDFGRHDDEHGHGFGAGAGWRVVSLPSGWHGGLRLDVWWLDLTWRDDPSASTGAGPRRGTTAVTVVQPTGRVWRRWRPASGVIRVEAGVSLGAEINVRTVGEDVGDGAILLVGFAVLFRVGPGP